MVLLVLGTGLSDPRSHVQFFLPEQGQLLVLYVCFCIYSVG